MKGVSSKYVQESIRGLLKTNKNYITALKILRERYANKEVLISSYRGRFVKLQPIRSIENASGLTAMYDSVEGVVRNLSSEDDPSDTYGKILVQLLIKKIPHSLRLVISREFDDKAWDFLHRKIVLRWLITNPIIITNGMKIVYCRCLLPRRNFSIEI